MSNRCRRVRGSWNEIGGPSAGSRRDGRESGIERWKEKENLQLDPMSSHSFKIGGAGEYDGPALDIEHKGPSEGRDRAVGALDGG
jgi:hypothetical protein